jgi:hypothetical protein
MGISHVSNSGYVLLCRIRITWNIVSVRSSIFVFITITILRRIMSIKITFNWGGGKMMCYFHLIQRIEKSVGNSTLKRQTRISCSQQSTRVIEQERGGKTYHCEIQGGASLFWDSNNMVPRNVASGQRIVVLCEDRRDRPSHQKTSLCLATIRDK